MQVAELLQQLRDLINTFVSAYNSTQGQRQAEEVFAPVLDAIVDPAIQMCENSAALLADKRCAALSACGAEWPSNQVCNNMAASVTGAGLHLQLRQMTSRDCASLLEHVSTAEWC